MFANAYCGKRFYANRRFAIHLIRRSHRRIGESTLKNHKCDICMAKADGSGHQPQRIIYATLAGPRRTIGTSTSKKRRKNMGKNQPDCANCSMRRKYESNPKSLMGRFWRWHINFCPGWKQYFSSLPEDGKEELRTRYVFHKY